MTRVRARDRIRDLGYCMKMKLQPNEAIYTVYKMHTSKTFHEDQKDECKCKARHITLK